MLQLTTSEKKYFLSANLNQFKLLIYYVLDNIEAQPELHTHLKSLINSEIYDHLEGGFYTQPGVIDEGFNHTKSLINNANVIDILSSSSGIYFDPVFSLPAINSLQWLTENLQSPDGFFYLEMENENTQSNYYFLTHQQIQQQLDNDAYLILKSAYNLSTTDSYLQPLKLHRNIQQISEHTDYHLKHVPLLLESAHQQLISLRKLHPSPSINQTFNLIANTKIISSLYAAATLFNRNDFALAADKALANIKLRVNASTSSITDLFDNLWLVQALIKRLSYQWSDDLFQWLISLALEVVQSQHYINTILSGDHCESIINDFNILYFFSSKKIFLDTANLLYENLNALITSSNQSNTTALLTLAATVLEPKVIIIRGQNFQVTSWQQQISSGFKPYQFIFAVGNKSVGPDPIKYPTTSSVIAYNPCLNSTILEIESVNELLNCCP